MPNAIWQQSQRIAMIKYGLKLWTSNERHIFEEAAVLCHQGKTDFIEVYNNPAAPIDYQKLSLIQGLPVNIHNPNTHGWHEFVVNEALLQIWQETLKLADFFNSRHIVTHPGRIHTFSSFLENLKKIDDPRILIENMPGVDIRGQPYLCQARTVEDLKRIKEIKDICLDLEKAVKSAKQQEIDYKDFIAACLKELKPFYFHISGGNKDSPVDEHKDLWDANFNIAWLKRVLNKEAKNRDVYLVFEVPKNDSDLENDLKNINFFKQSK